MIKQYFKPKELKVDAINVLGRGAFACVYKGHLKKKRGEDLIDMEVAVKFCHEYATQLSRYSIKLFSLPIFILCFREDMLKEIEFMKLLGIHANLLSMIGCVNSADNPVIITEYCLYGDLLKVLRSHQLHFMVIST